MDPFFTPVKKSAGAEARLEEAAAARKAMEEKPAARQAV